MSWNLAIDHWVLIVGCLSSSCCAVLGCFLVLRRMSLLGDAISHAVLPGLAVSYLLTGEISFVPMFLGGLVAGVLTAFLTQALHSLGRVPEDSSMGVVYTSLFAVGVLLVSQLDSVHLDTDCVLFGMIDTVSLTTTQVAGIELPDVLWSLLPVSLLTAAFVLLFWKELKISSFDPLLATTMGISGVWMHYLLMGMVASATVASLEAVGAILVIAMLIVPGATAHLLCDRLGWMIFWSVIVASLSAVIGSALAFLWNTETAGMMAVAAGGQFVLAVFLAPRHGLFVKAWHNLQLSLRIVGEDLIALLYRLEEDRRQPHPEYPVHPTPAACREFTGGGLLARLAIPWLRRRGQVTLTAAGLLQLTDSGRELGRSLVRSHRLWEAYLDQHFNLPPDHLHAPASRIEHYIGPALQDQLAASLRQPSQDPHGTEIPPATPGEPPPPT